jgi:hypothetical protein
MKCRTLKTTVHAEEGKVHVLVQFGSFVKENNIFQLAR